MTPAAKRTRVAALGECMIELRQQDPATLSVGFAGDTLNTTTYLRRLLPPDNYDVDYITALGDDPMSSRMIDAWRDEGIGCDLVRRLDDALPGIYWISNDEHGEREFRYWRNAAAARRVLEDGFGQRIAGSLNAGDMLYLSAISTAILSPADRERLLALIDDLRKSGVAVAYDGNYRARLWESPADAARFHESMLTRVDRLITSLPDENAMFGDKDLAAAERRIATYDIADWVIRAAPGETVSSDGGHLLCPPRETGVIDTTGAGDAFDAAWLAARLSGADGEASIRAGHRLAAIVVGSPGAIIEASETPDLETLLAPD